MNPVDLHEILSGRRKTVSATLLRLGLSLLEPAYSVGVQVIRFLYNVGLKKIVRVSRPVISVGNITTGGTGKTPVVALLVNILTEMGHRPGIASRGYRSLEQNRDSDLPAANDEKLMLDQICPGIPHTQNTDRLVAARELIRAHNCSCIVLDDGFQHRRLDRDLDIVLIDAAEPFGYGHLLPRGLLREPLTSLARADLICLTRCEQVSVTARAEIQETLRLFSRADIIDIAFQPTGWLTIDGMRLTLSDSPVTGIAFCGIGHPDNFRQLLSLQGIQITDDNWFPFADHYHYTPADLQPLLKRASEQHLELLTTQKDLVKLQGINFDSVQCRALLIEAVIKNGTEILQNRLKQILMN